MKRPNPRDFGFQEGGYEEETGWTVEGGREAFYAAFEKYCEFKGLNPEEEFDSVICKAIDSESEDGDVLPF